MISIIVPVYNAEKYLCRCVDSIINQSYSDFELLLINDGSADNSWSLCTEYEGYDKRVKCINSENHGVSAARNLGLEYASGEYIWFVDSDDYVPENALQLLVTPYMNMDTSIELVVGNYDSNIPGAYNNLEKGKVDISTYLYDFSRHFNSFYYGVVWNKLYRADIIKENKLNFDINYNWGEDFVFNCKYCCLVKNIYLQNEKIYFYDSKDTNLANEIKKIYGISKIIIDIERLELAYELIDKHALNSDITYNFLNYFLSALSNSFVYCVNIKEIDTIKKCINDNRLQRLLEKIVLNRVSSYYYRLLIWAIRHKSARLIYFIINIKGGLLKPILSLKNNKRKSKTDFTL